MSILETLEDLVDALRGTHSPTRAGINDQTLQVATQYNTSLRTHFGINEEDSLEQVESCSDDHTLSQARQEMDQLKLDIARLKAQLHQV